MKGEISQSLPVWEEWIEIPAPHTALPLDPRLSPHGESGLKQWTLRCTSEECLSPHGESGLKSLPDTSDSRRQRLSLYRESGLKFLNLCLERGFFKSLPV